MKFKEYNEYRDKLCDPLVSGYLGALGCDIYSPECWIVNEEIEEQQLDHVIDSWAGQVPEGFIFHSYRYTLNFAQTWLRDNYDIHVFCLTDSSSTQGYYFRVDGFVLNGQYHEESEGERNLKYEEALESGIKSALLKLLKEKF